MSKLYEALRNAKADAEAPVPARALPAIRAAAGSTEAGATRLYHAIEARLPHHTSRVVVVMGCSEGAGVSTVAANTARMASVIGGRRVLLLNAGESMAVRPRLADRQRVNGEQISPHEGQSEPPPRLFMGNLPFEGGHLASINADKLRAYWDRLREQLDLVVIDAPSLFVSPVGLALSPTVDGVVLVVEAEQTRTSAAAAARDAVRATGANLLGVVLNKRRFYVPGFLYDHL